MNLGELKRSLSRMSPDLDDCEVVMIYASAEGKSEYDKLGFTAYTELPDSSVAFILGSDKEAHNRIAKRTLRYPDGSLPSEESLGLND